LIVLTIVLAGVFLVRSSITVEPMGKILAFIGLCVLPTLCIGAGMSFHMQRSQQTSYCISCHSMESHGESLHVLDTSYIPAQHFQNHLVPPDKACYTCHTDYTMYGPLKDKIKGLKYLYLEYVSSPPKIIHIDGTYSNLQCLHCHAGMRSFDENPAHTAIMGSLKANQISCISCHSTIHNASEVDHLKMWVDGDVPTSVPAGSPASVPADAKPAAAAAPSKAPAGGSPANATAAGGKAIFDSHGCSGCHGESGAGGAGPALTHISNQYPPAQLTAVLKAPTAKMTAAGMVPLTLDAADMKALVSYVSGLGGTSASPVATPIASGAASAPAANAEPTATATPSIDGSKGEAIFKAHGCADCHGANGVGGTAPRLAGQNGNYMVNQLLRFGAGDRAHAIKMTTIAKELDKEQIRAVAAFLASQ
jgi:cytochrome c-type protein NapC